MAGQGLWETAVGPASGQSGTVGRELKLPARIGISGVLSGVPASARGVSPIPTGAAPEGLPRRRQAGPVRAGMAGCGGGAQASSQVRNIRSSSRCVRKRCFFVIDATVTRQSVNNHCPDGAISDASTAAPFDLVQKYHFYTARGGEGRGGDLAGLISKYRNMTAAPRGGAEAGRRCQGSGRSTHPAALRFTTEPANTIQLGIL